MAVPDKGAAVAFVVLVLSTKKDVVSRMRFTPVSGPSKNSAVSIDVAIRVNRRYTTEMCIKHLRPLRENPLADEINEALHGFSLIDRIRHHAFHASAQTDSCIGFF